MLNKKTSRGGAIVAFVLSGVFIAVAALLFLNRQHVLDQLSVWSFTPTSQIQSVNERVGFTDRGKFVFYATKPSLENQDGFNKNCPRQESGSPILGCYTSLDRIFIYDLSDEQLDGMEEVTAAHEMLHAVWFRMDEEEKSRLTVQLEAAYEKLDDPRLKERMDYYQRTEPTEIPNELHSILGTEVPSLGSDLEEYYAKYFDRGKVLALHQQYNSVYTALYSRADELYAQLESLSQTIEKRSESYNAAVAQLSADIDSFNSRAGGGTFTSQSQFNAERAALVRRTTELEAERSAINAEIDTYNTYNNEYKAIASKIEGLNSSLDSFKQIDEAPAI